MADFKADRCAAVCLCSRGICVGLFCFPGCRIKVIEPEQGKAQYSKCNTPCNTAGIVPLFLIFFFAGSGRGFEGDPSGFERNGFSGTDVHTPGAVDALMITYMPDIHAAVTDAVPAAIAFVPIYFHTDQTEAVEKSIDGPQRADEAAEAAVAEDAGKA